MEHDDNVWVDSGTILGGFAAPVDIGFALAHYHSPRISVPELLASDFVSSESVVADAAGTFIVALVTTATVNNMGVETVNAFTSPPGGSFGTATTFPVTLFDNLDLNIAAGRATLVWNGSSGAFESTEPVS